MSGLYQRRSQSLGGLLDTDLTTLANDEVLTYENESWKNKPAGGGTSYNDGKNGGAGRIRWRRRRIWV